MAGAIRKNELLLNKYYDYIGAIIGYFRDILLNWFFEF